MSSHSGCELTRYRFKIAGWSIKQAKVADAAGGTWKAGDILYDVKLERQDSVSWTEVSKHPLAAEVDDYTEYKRLRKLYRETKHLPPSAPQTQTDVRWPPKIAPPITSVPKDLPQQHPSTARPSIFRLPQYGNDSPRNANNLSILAAMDDDQSPFNQNESKSIMLFVPPNLDGRSTPQVPEETTSLSYTMAHDNPAGSKANSIRTTTSANLNIKEVAPWLNFETSLTLPTPSTDASTEDVFGSPKSRRTYSIKSQSHPRRWQDKNSFQGARPNGKNSTFLKPTPEHVEHSILGTDGYESVGASNRSPRVKLFDGVEDYDGDYMGSAAHNSPEKYMPVSSKTPKGGQHERAMSADDNTNAYIPSDDRPLTPDTPFKMARRNAICPANDYVSLLSSTLKTTKRGMRESEGKTIIGIAPPARHASTSPLMSSSDVKAPPRQADASIDSLITPTRESASDPRTLVVASHRAKQIMHDAFGKDVKVAFYDPFSGSPKKKRVDRESSEHIAPDSVV